MDFLDLMHARFSIVEIIRTIACQSVAVEAMDTVVSLTPRCKYFEDLMLGALWVVKDRPYPLPKKKFVIEFSWWTMRLLLS